MKSMKAVAFFVSIFFIGCISFIAAAGEGRPQKGHAAKSAPRGPAAPRGQGNIQKRGLEHGQQMHHGDRRGQPGRGGFDGHRPGGVSRHVVHHNFHGRHYHGFTVYERRIWHGGGWRNGCFRGHCGAWWVTGGYWYYYPDRFYGVLYPSVISAVVYEAALIEASILAQAVVPVAPVVVTRPPIVVAPQAPVLYYCPDPPGYSTEIQNCNVGWQTRAMPPPPSK